jgi:twitching motility two-component system response regulator PilG
VAAVRGSYVSMFDNQTESLASDQSGCRKMGASNNQKWEANTMSQEGGRIMVIDDSPTIRTILKVGLHRAGFEVECYEDGVEALRSLKDSERQILPDLIILDVMLPKCDGYEVVRRLKSCPALSGIVVVMLSGREGMLDRLKGRLAGAKVYLTKPFRIDEIVMVVRKQLEIA